MVLVGIDGCRLVEVVLSERRREEIVEERGLEDAALSHKDEHHLVDRVGAYPSYHHRHDPLAEVLPESGLVVVIPLLRDDVYAVG